MVFGFTSTHWFNQCPLPLKLQVRFPHMKWPYVIKFVSDLWQSDAFFQVLRIPQPTELTNMTENIAESGGKLNITHSKYAHIWGLMSLIQNLRSIFLPKCKTIQYIYTFKYTWATAHQLLQKLLDCLFGIFKFCLNPICLIHSRWKIVEPECI